MTVCCVDRLRLGDRLAKQATVGTSAAVQCLPDAKTWFTRFMTGPGIKEAAITAAIAIDASDLPGDFHSDPIDQLIVATARHLGLPVVIRDGKIIAYADACYVGVIAC